MTDPNNGVRSEYVDHARETIRNFAENDHLLVPGEYVAAYREVLAAAVTLERATRTPDVPDLEGARLDALATLAADEESGPTLTDEQRDVLYERVDQANRAP